MLDCLSAVLMNGGEKLAHISNEYIQLLSERVFNSYTEQLYSLSMKYHVNSICSHVQVVIFIIEGEECVDPEENTVQP